MEDLSSKGGGSRRGMAWFVSSCALYLIHFQVSAPRASASPLPHPKGTSFSRRRTSVPEKETVFGLSSILLLQRKLRALVQMVSRSRSVGCGSRSFSSDFFERISSGLGDCTLRRVESQREGGKPKLPASANTMNHCMKERVRCGGIFSGFVMNSSSSTTSSSSWVSSSVDDGRGRSWGWAFASPMRAFTTKGSPPSSSSKRDASDKNNATPNLSAIPTLLTVRG